MLRTQPLSTDFRALHHAIQLMAVPSITPNDNGCQWYLAERLSELGFEFSHHQINGVSNLIARWGNGCRHLAFCGHTDVVPPGPVERWTHNPFSPTVERGTLYGRGAADMKTGIAAMLGACQQVLPLLSPDKVTFWWLITSDEEGEAEHGSKWIKRFLDDNNISLESVLVGEPTARQRTGDCLKVGRRGSLSASVKIQGKQGHVAYPEQTKNAIHAASTFVQMLQSHTWDTGNPDFPGTGCQITGIHSGETVDNLVPGFCQIDFNIRYSHAFCQTSLKQLIESLAEASLSHVSYEIHYSRPCESYFSQPRDSDTCLIRMCEQAIVHATGQYPVMSTSGGTSDARFFASDDTQVVELGVPNASIHQIDENVHLSDLATLEDIYADILQHWIT